MNLAFLIFAFFVYSWDDITTTNATEDAIFGIYVL